MINPSVVPAALAVRGSQAVSTAIKAKECSTTNISSNMELVAYEEEPAYNASRAAVGPTRKSAALHCAADNSAVRASSVHPGFVETSLTSVAAANIKREDAEAIIGRLYPNIPMQETEKTEDIANGCLYLAADKSADVTGSQLVIEGRDTFRQRPRSSEAIGAFRLGHRFDASSRIFLHGYYTTGSGN